MIRALAAALLLLAAAPASSGDLIRFRAADGSIGLVDHPSKLPPGAVVLNLSERTKRAEPTPTPERTSQPAAPAAARRDAYGTSSSPGPGSTSGSSSEDGWCSRGRSADQRIERAEERLASAEDAYDRCDDGGRINHCSRSSLEGAEEELERARAAQNELEADCRRAGCEPGWVRCAP